MCTGTPVRPPPPRRLERPCARQGDLPPRVAGNATAATCPSCPALDQLRGYENGEWIGVPPELLPSGRIPDLPKPRPFHCHSWFDAERVAEIEALGQQVAKERIEPVRFS